MSDKPSPCLSCARARQKLERAGLIECKIREVPASELLVAFYAFQDQKGWVNTPFVVRVTWDGRDNAWPFQFDPAVIVECEGWIAADAQGA